MIQTYTGCSVSGLTLAKQTLTGLLYADRYTSDQVTGILIAIDAVNEALLMASAQQEERGNPNE